MTDHGNHQIMVRDVHRVDAGAHRLDQFAQPRQRRRVTIPRRGQQPPAVLEQRGKARPRARVFRSGHRMAGDEMHTFRQVRGHRIDHGLFDRSDICHGRPRRQMGADLGGDGAHRADRHRKNHKVRALHGLGRRIADLVAEQLSCDSPRLGRFGMAHDLGREATGPHRMRHRRGDQSQPDQRDAAIGHFTPLNCATAWAT